MFIPDPRSWILDLDFFHPGSGSRIQESKKDRIRVPGSVATLKLFYSLCHVSYLSNLSVLF
jgi:hypothetical protein